MKKYRWKYAKKDTFDRSTNAKLRNFLLLKSGQQNNHSETYSEIFHIDHVDTSFGADFHEDVYALIKQTNVLVGVQEPDLLSEQENKYFRVNTGGAKQLGMPIQTLEGLESDFYTLIITFLEIDMVLDTLGSQKYQATSPV